MDKMNDGFDRADEYPLPESTPKADFLELDENDEGYHQAYLAYEKEQEKSGPELATVSMILGIIGLLTSCAFLFPFAVLSLIFGIIALKQHRSGKVMAIIGIVSSAVTFIVYFALLAFIIYNY